jgi:hypothetical protein
MAQDLRWLQPRRDVELLVCPRPSGVSVGDRNNVTAFSSYILGVSAQFKILDLCT